MIDGEEVHETAHALAGFYMALEFLGAFRSR
jgi:hypothetical protein